MESPMVSHLSVVSVPLAGALAGSARSHLLPPADRTACGACENVRNRTVILPVKRETVRAGRPALGFIVLLSLWE
jgi:hypothetical protein